MGYNIFLGYYITSTICLWMILSAILLNFYFSKKGNVKKVKKSVVETGSMLGFFFVMVLLVYKKIGALYLNSEVAQLLATVGTMLIIIGTIINVTGRLSLKGNWGNQIIIYENHTLTQTGIYHYIRHPLYSSTILMIFGFSLLFSNYLVFICNAILFVPFMIYRANQEDKLLYSTFQDDFVKYKAATGLFIPKLRKRGS